MTKSYEKELEQRLEALETKYGYMKAKLDELEGTAELEQRLQDVRHRLEELRDRGEGAFEELRGRAETAWKEAEGALERLKQRFGG